MKAKEFLPEYIQPFSGEAERRLLGALLHYRERIPDVSLEVTPDDLYLVQSKWVYEAICALYIDGVPVNIETVSNALRNKAAEDGKSRLEQIGGGDYIVDLVSGVESDEIDYWVQTIKSKTHERKLLEFFTKGKELLFEGKTPASEIQHKLEAALANIVPETKTHSVSIENSVNDIDSILQRYYDKPDGIAGISSGYSQLDGFLDGFKPGNVTILYAPSSKFKSLFALNLNRNIANQGIPGLSFTTEMPRYQVLERLLQLEAGRNIGKLRKEGKYHENFDALKSYKAKLAQMPIYLCDLSSPNIEQVRADVSRFKRWHDIQYVIIDLIDHVSSNRFKDEMINNQRHVMYAMKSIAKDFDIHVILVSHIAKQRAEDRSSADLDVESMIGSSAKYQDVDAALSISPWERVYDYKTGQATVKAMTRDTLAWHMATFADIPLLVAITKNRHGPLGMVNLKVELASGGRITETIDKV